MTADGIEQIQASEELREVNFIYPDQHEHNPDLEEEDWLEEPLKAVQVGLRQWRLQQNPVLSEAVAFGDTVEGDFDDVGDFIIERIVERSEFRTIRTMVPRMFYFSDFGKAFLDQVMKAGGMWEIVFWGILILNLPESQADELEELFHAACKEANTLGDTERTPPNQLYRQRPEGGAGQPEEDT